MDVVLPGGAVHAVQDRPDPQCRRAGRGAGRGVRRGDRLRLLLLLSSLLARVRCPGPVLPGASDPRREVPDDAARRAGPGLWDEVARGVAGVVRGDPSPGAVVDRGVSEPTGGGTGRGVALWHIGCAGDEAQSQPGETV